MIKFVIDGNIVQKKNDILSIFKEKLSEMYSLNYDALADVLTAIYDENVIIELYNLDKIIDYTSFIKVLDCIKNENTNIQIIKNIP